MCACIGVHVGGKFIYFLDSLSMAWRPLNRPGLCLPGAGIRGASRHTQLLYMGSGNRTQDLVFASTLLTRPSLHH